MVDGRSAIDALRHEDGSLGRSALKAVLPYGKDFLFVDRVSRLTAQEVEASFQIPERSTYLDSHFEDLPIMPGVLVGEGLAQAGSLVVRYNHPAQHEQHVLGVSIEKARFGAPALPGEILTYRVRVTASDARIARLEGDARVGDREVCRARLVVAIVNREAFRDKLGARRR